MINCVKPKPKKLSKSDKIDKEQEARDRELLTNKTYSQHFHVGSRVYANNMGGTVLWATVKPSGTYLCIPWDDGSISFIKPFALNR